MYARALNAHLALAEGDSMAALQRFAALHPTAPSEGLAWDEAEPLAVERLVHARLLLALQRYQEAYDVAAGFDLPSAIIFLPFIRPSLVIRLEAARALGRADLAARAEERLRRLGAPTSAPDPFVQ